MTSCTSARLIFSSRAVSSTVGGRAAGVDGVLGADGLDRAVEEAAGIESAFRVELELDGSHEGEGIGRSAPGVERGHGVGAVLNDERAGFAFERGAEGLERGSEIGGPPLEENCGDAKGLGD